ncbi:MAG TPA: integrin alpha [Candidatus Polarisedimenticolia bacterium]|nr:integrin alpha [Candidatus Polarisedimenticolia bacterium]
MRTQGSLAPLRRALLAGSAAAAAAGLAPYGDLIELARSGQAADDSYGQAADGGGDVDGDGFDDHLVTAIFNDDAASAAGKAYLYFGRAPAALEADLALLGEAADDQFGISAAIGGDFNADGFDDIAVGARFSDRAGKDTGSVFLFFGGPRPGLPGGMDALPDRVMTGERQDDWFGTSVDFAGDFNGDGVVDLVVGAPFNDDTGSAAGKGYVYFGGPAADALPDVFLFGDPQDDGQFGWSVSRAGDVNGDGYDDIIAGARLFGSGLSRAIGRAYVFLGGASPDGVPDVVMTGEARDDWFGNTVSEAGDFNADGFDDVAVAGIFWDDFSDPLAPRSAAGKVYLFHGGPLGVMDGQADWSAAGQGADDQFGFALAHAGDVDGDGASDLLVGAPFHDHDGDRAAGRVDLFLGRAGGAVPPSTAAFLRTGEAADDQLGSSVAGAGDGNGDGLSSFLAGARFSDPGGSGSGSATLSLLDCLDLDVAGSGIVWGGCAAHALIDLRRGDPSGLAAGDPGACLAASPAVSPVDDPQTPAPGAAFTYLAAVRNQADPNVSTSGFGSGGRARPPSPPCP